MTGFLPAVVETSAIAPSTGLAGGVTVRLKFVEATVNPSLAEMVMTEVPVALATRATDAVTAVPLFAMLIPLTRFVLDQTALNTRLLTGVTALVTGTGTVTGTLALVVVSAIWPSTGGGGATTVKVKL